LPWNEYTVILSVAAKVIPKERPNASCAGSAASYTIAWDAVLPAAPAILANILNVTLDRDVLHTFIVEIIVLLPAGTTYTSAYVLFVGIACPKILNVVAIIFPYNPLSMNDIGLTPPITVVVEILDVVPKYLISRLDPTGYCVVVVNVVPDTV